MHIFDLHPLLCDTTSQLPLHLSLHHCPPRSTCRGLILRLYCIDLQLSYTTLPLPFYFHLHQGLDNSNCPAYTVLLHRPGLPLFYTTLQLLPCFLPHHSHSSNNIPDETLPVPVPAPPLCDTRKQPYSHLPLRQNQNHSRNQCHSVQSPTPVRLLFCTTLPSFPDFFPHHFHFCSRGQYYTVPAQGPALPLHGSIQTPVLSLL